MSMITESEIEIPAAGFDTFWERCIRELGVSAQDPEAVARWCYEKAIKEQPQHSARCWDGSPHSWVVLSNREGHARCVFCGTIVKL